MANMDDVRDEMIRAAERIVGRSLTSQERSRLIDKYNSYPNSDEIYHKCRRALEEVFGITLDATELLEKTASVDRALNAIKNLRQLSSRSVKKP